MGDDKEIKHNVVGPIERANHVIVPSLPTEIEPLLIAQGCQIIKGEKSWNHVTIVQYPPNSTRSELFPRTMQSRYIVTLPNGFELLEVINRAGECVALYVDNPERQ